MRELKSKNTGETMQSKGGIARAKKLSAEDRKMIASKAAEARWNKELPFAPFNGELPVGDKKIPCSVLEDGTRLITTRGVLLALDRPWRGTYEGNESPNFIAASNLMPFVGSEMGGVPTPIKYRTESGAVKEGYPASILRQVCNVYLVARRAGVLKRNQEPIAVAAEIVLNAFAETGIAALIDEVTGYQDYRAKDALAKILEEYIADELRAWTKTFPVEFYRQIFRLRRWPFDPSNVKKPGVIGHWTNDIVYKRLAPGVLDELRKKTPKTPKGNRKNKYFQWLSGEIGHPKLLAHLEGVTLLMKLSDDWDGFMEKLNEHYRIIETTELGFDLDVTPGG